MSTVIDEIAVSYEENVKSTKNNEANGYYLDRPFIEGMTKGLDELQKIQDISQPKKKEKTQSSKLHINQYFSRYFHPKNPKNKVNNCEQITYEVLVEEGDHLTDTLATFLATKATLYGKPDTELISMNSADAYFSAFKIMCIEKFSKEKAEELPCFAKMKWSRMRDSILSIKMDQAKKKG